MTESQQRYLDAIRAISNANCGARPTVNDIARHTGYAVNAAHEAVARLERDGVIRRYRIGGKCRGVEVV